MAELNPRTMRIVPPFNRGDATALGGVVVQTVGFGALAAGAAVDSLLVTAAIGIWLLGLVVLVAGLRRAEEIDHEWHQQNLPRSTYVEVYGRGQYYHLDGTPMTDEEAAPFRAAHSADIERAMRRTAP